MISKVKKLEPIAKKPVRAQSKKVVIDTDIVNSCYKHLENSVVYGIFGDNSDINTVSADTKRVFKGGRNDICFYGLLGDIRKSKGNNRMFFKLTTTSPTDSYNSNPPILTKEECELWVALAKKYKLLPPYINEEVLRETEKGAVKGTFIIDLNKTISPALLYIYLSTIRNMREDPGLPKAVLYLVNELGMNFYLAYTFASLVVVSGTGHHIVNLSRSYGLSNGTASMPIIEEKVSVPMYIVIGIQRMLNNPSKYDKRALTDKEGHGFNCANTIESISKVKSKIAPSDLFNEDVIAATMSETDGQADKYLIKFATKKAKKCKEVSK